MANCVYVIGRRGSRNSAKGIEFLKVVMIFLKFVFFLILRHQNAKAPKHFKTLHYYKNPFPLEAVNFFLILNANYKYWFGQTTN